MRRFVLTRRRVMGYFFGTPQSVPLHVGSVCHVATRPIRVTTPDNPIWQAIHAYHCAKPCCSIFGIPRRR